MEREIFNNSQIVTSYYQACVVTLKQPITRYHILLSGLTCIQRLKEICQTSLNINYKKCVRTNNVLTHVDILI